MPRPWLYSEFVLKALQPQFKCSFQWLRETFPAIVVSETNHYHLCHFSKFYFLVWPLVNLRLRKNFATGLKIDRKLNITVGVLRRCDILSLSAYKHHHWVFRVGKNLKLTCISCFHCHSFNIYFTNGNSKLPIGRRVIISMSKWRGSAQHNEGRYTS